MLGDRIKQARKASGLSQRDLADKAGVSAMAISKYESNQSTPSSGVLLGLAKALGVRTEYFFRRAVVSLENVNHREHEKLPEKEEEKVRADATEQLERWVELEEFVPAPWSKPFDLPPKLPETIHSYEQIEDVAIRVREHWKLGMNPIPDLIDTLETKGIKVIITQYDGHKDFNGLSATVNNSPVVVVGKHWTGDRQRFTLAHELGHLVLDGRLSNELDLELACNRFAGAFLVPNEMVRKALGDYRKWIEPQELMLLKHEWGLSMQAWSYRAHQQGVTTKDTHSQMWRKYLQEYKEQKREPDPQLPQEVTRLFQQLVFRALAEELISESKAAELLGVPLYRFHECRMLQCPEGIETIAEKFEQAERMTKMRSATVSAKPYSGAKVARDKPSGRIREKDTNVGKEGTRAQKGKKRA